MSQAVPKPGTGDKTDKPYFLEGEVYEVEAGNPEEIRALQAYAMENPGVTFLINYDLEALSLGALEKIEGADGITVYNRLTGGGNEPVDSGTRAVIASDDSCELCYQSFKRELKELLDTQWPEDRPGTTIPTRENGTDAKDIYLEEGEDPNHYPKIIRTAARLTPHRMYGAVWRNNPPTKEMEEVIERMEGLSVEDWEKHSEPLGEEGEELWEQLTATAETKSPEEILQETGDPERFDYSRDQKHPTKNCATDIGPESTDKRTPGWSGELRPREQTS